MILHSVKKLRCSTAIAGYEFLLCRRARLGAQPQVPL